jgi:hypothetical protein
MAHLLIPQGRACVYRSVKDEAAFFAWLRSIPGVVKVEGVGRRLVVTLRSSRLSDAALRELIALHARYKLPMRSLAQFETSKNKAWFRSQNTYWYRKVFGVRSNNRWRGP